MNSTNPQFGRRDFLTATMVLAATAMLPGISTANSATLSMAKSTSPRRRLAHGSFSHWPWLQSYSHGALALLWKSGRPSSLIREAYERGVTYFDFAGGMGPFYQRRVHRRGTRPGAQSGRHRQQVWLRHWPIRRASRSPAARRISALSWKLHSSVCGRAISICSISIRPLDPHSVPIEDVAGTVQRLVDEGKVLGFRPVRVGRAMQRYAAPTLNCRWRRCKTNTPSGHAIPKARCCKPAKNWASALRPGPHEKAISLAPSRHRRRSRKVSICGRRCGVSPSRR